MDKQRKTKNQDKENGANDKKSQNNSKKFVGGMIIFFVFYALFNIFGIFPSMGFNQHFSGNGVSFDYPEEWSQKYTYDLPSEVVWLTKKMYNNDVIFDIPMIAVSKEKSGSKSLKKWKKEKEAPNENDYLDNVTSVKNITIDGVQGYQITSISQSTPKDKIYEYSTTFFIKNGYIYTINFQTTKNNLKNLKKDINIVLTSFKTTK